MFKRYTVLLIAAGLFAVLSAGCEPKETVSPRETAAIAETPDIRDYGGGQEVSYENFLKLVPGMTSDEVSELLGLYEMGESAETGDFSYNYQSGLANVGISVSFSDYRMVSASFMDFLDMAFEPVGVTSEQFDLLEPGMSYDEIKGIIGAEGNLEFIYAADADFNPNYKYVWASQNNGFNYRRISATLDGGMDAVFFTQDDLTMCEENAWLDYSLYRDIEVGIGFGQLEDSLGFMPGRHYSEKGADYSTDVYLYEDSSYANQIEFIFIDGAMYKKNVLRYTDEFFEIRTVSGEAADIIGAKMTEGEVTELLGAEGFLVSGYVSANSRESRVGTYNWNVGDGGYLQILFTDGAIFNEGSIVRGY